ncbi:MAG: hypothetical protein LBR60_05065 [Fibrobacter sp.]|jgi:hypothetical protein|nr:hypothetical protein [Fibrobacter sp.]
MKYLYFIFCLILCACEYSEPAGLCHNPPTLSKDTLSFNAQGGTDSVIVSDYFWVIVEYPFWENNCEQYRGSISEYCAEEFCYGEIIKSKCSWFELQKTDAYTITISVNPNETNQERRFQVDMQAGNCGAGFTIIQSAE